LVYVINDFSVKNGKTKPSTPFHFLDVLWWLCSKAYSAAYPHGFNLRVTRLRPHSTGLDNPSLSDAVGRQHCGLGVAEHVACVPILMESKNACDGTVAIL
jgi:hypothetical protein